MPERSAVRWAATSARVVIGAVVSVAAVIAVVAGVTVSWPTLQQPPVAVDAVPAAQDTVLACTGSLLALGRDLENIDQISVAAQQQVTAGTASGAPAFAESVLTGPNDSVEGAQVLQAQPMDRARTDGAASGSATVADDDLAGFAASACRPPLMESWLVGGSASTGAADLIVLANPGAVASTVQLTTYGAEGLQAPAGGSDLVIAAGTQRVVPLAGLLLGEESPVVRVTATGAPVQASLQTSITRTLNPGGVDQVGAISAAQTDLVIPGVAVAAAPPTGDSADVTSLLRLLAPGADTTATVTVTEVDSSSSGEQSTVPLTAGVPTEVELPGLAVGEYTVAVSSDEPVVGAAWQATGLGEGDDFGWFVPAPELGETAMFATPAGPRPEFAVANTSTEPVTLTVVSVDAGNATELTVPAGESASLQLWPSRIYSLEGGGAGIHASLSLSGADALAGFPVWPADAAAPAITVYP